MTTDTTELISTGIRGGNGVSPSRRRFHRCRGSWSSWSMARRRNRQSMRRAACRRPWRRRPNSSIARRPEGGPFFDRNGLLFFPAAGSGGHRRDCCIGIPAPRWRRIRRCAAFLDRGAGASSATVRPGSAISNRSCRHSPTPSTRRRQASRRPSPGRMRWVASTTEHRAAGARRGASSSRPAGARLYCKPGQAASDAIRKTARSLGFDQAHGISCPVSRAGGALDEEFASLAELAPGRRGHGHRPTWHLCGGRSIRVASSGAILTTTFMGLLTTTGLALVTGKFNLISVPSFRCSSASSISASSSACVSSPNGTSTPI